MTQIKSIRRLLRRKTHFVSDMYARDMLYGLTLRSARARGRIRKLQLPEQYSHLRLVTAHDIPGENYLKVYGDAMPILAMEDVRYIGEPIGILVGPDLSELNTAIDHVIVDWDESYSESPLFDLRRPKVEQIALEFHHSFGTVPEDLRSEKSAEARRAENEPTEPAPNESDSVSPHEHDTEAVAGSTDSTVATHEQPSDSEETHEDDTASTEETTPSDTEQSTTTVQNGRVYSHHTTGAQEHLYNEPQGAFCTREDKTRIVVHCATQWPFLVRDTVAKVLGIPVKNCVVRSADIGTSLDGKLWYPALCGAHAALVCHVTGKPVKIMYSREEDFRFSSKRAPSHTRYATQLNENGEIEAIDITVHVAIGAYGVFTHEMLARTARAAVGRYRHGGLRITARAVRTNIPPANVFAGFGDAAGSFALESHISRITSATEYLPSSWKAANLLMQGDTDLAGTRVEVDVDGVGVIEKVVAASDFNRKHAACELRKKRQGEIEDLVLRPRGIGIAFSDSVDGFLNHGEAATLSSTVKVRLDADGKASIYTSAVVENFSIQQHWIHSVSEILGIAENDVEIVEGDTDSAPDSGPSTLSRNTAVISKLIESCANTIKRRRFRDPLPLEARKTIKAAKGKKSAPDWKRAITAPSDALVACVVEVELEPATLSTCLRGIWLSVEAGRILDQEQARKALEAGVAQALGWVDGEVIRYHDGEITADGYELYRAGRAPSRDKLHIEFVNNPAKRSPHGIESLPGLVLPAAYLAATAQAGGVSLDSIPSGPAAIVGKLEGL